MFLMFMAELTTAVLQHINFFYLFDSHSRDMHRLYVADGTDFVADGTDFESLSEIKRYIQVVCLQYKDIIIFSNPVYKYRH